VSALRVLYWVFNYMPQWEAVSKEISALRQGLDEIVDESLISLNSKERGLRLWGRDKRIPLALGVPLYPLFRPYASHFDINHLFASAGERFLTPIISRCNGVLTVAKDTASLRGFEGNKESFSRLRAIVVQSERDREILRQMGVRNEAIRLIRPGIPGAPYREAQGPFTILFASSPLTATDFLTRGIYLIVRVAALLPDVRFLLVWRKRHLAKLERMIATSGLRNITVANGLIDDMAAVYDRVHASILPALEPRSFIPCPRSGLESLAHGKPLLLSNMVSIASSVARSRAGVVFEPTTEGLKQAIQQLQEDYSSYQANTQSYITEKFSPSTHLALYQQLYHTLMGS
jgi:glycosyltransferase involved in cell wall biosynthesis